MMANKFSNYFTGIARSLARKIPESSASFESYLSAPSILISFGLCETYPEKILSFGHSIPLTHSRGVDDIDPYITIPCLDCISSPLTEVINCSFKSGVFREALKVVKVVPVFKREAKDEISN